jgi:hypothetical protein
MDHVGIEAATFFAPIVSTAVRSRLLARAVEVQIDHGDESSLFLLLDCSESMNLLDAARLFVNNFGSPAPLFPTMELVNLLRRGGDVYWNALLLRRLGGDEALFVTANEIIAAGVRAEQRLL